MPFIRHTRDKRGYEATYVMHAYRAGSGPHRTRILYVFRSPGGLRIGRQPLDDEVKEALEHTHPDLSFDWQALLRESGEPVRVKSGGQSPPKGGRTSPKAPPAPPPVSAPADDGTLLGRVLGAETASRLRSRFSEWLGRIGRRARSPEERDKLTDRLRRLNPDDWTDEQGIRASAGTIETQWMGVGAELPARRRGRRGGRRRAASLAPGPSGIIERIDEAQNVITNDSSSGGPDRPADVAGDDGRGGTADTTAAADTPTATDTDIPGDD